MKNMKLPISNKTASFGIRPHIKKGFYPAKLLSIEPYADKDGNLREGKYGRQLLFEFAIFHADPETGVPTKPVSYVADPSTPNIKEFVKMVKFVYHEYKDKNTGDFQTAITANSAITKLLKALGWEFDASKSEVEVDDLIGNWVEVCIDDYEHKDKQTEEITIASTITTVKELEAEIPKDIEEVKKKEPKDIKRQVKHQAVETKKSSTTEEIVLNEDRQKQANQLEELLNGGLLSRPAYAKGIESLEAEQVEDNAKG